MKNDRLHATWPHAGATPSNLDRFCADRTLTLGQPTPTSAATESASTVMGLQPLTHAANRLPHLVVSCAPSGGVGVAAVTAPDQNCSCILKPQDRTILHGILTGQGHKFGYGDAYISPGYTDTSSGLADSDNGLCPNNNNNNNNNSTQSSDDHQQVHSQEVTLPSKCTIQLQDK